MSTVYHAKYFAHDLVRKRPAADVRELADTKAQIKATNWQTRLATTLQEQHALQEKICELEKQMPRQRQRIFDVEDEIIAKRDGLIAGLEKRLSQRTIISPLFTIRWVVA
jgi:hypothetical protein